MASRSLAIADALVEAINNDEISLPAEAAGVVWASPLALSGVAPEVRRDVDQKLRVFVSVDGREFVQPQTRDRCPPQWATRLILSVEKQLTHAEAEDEHQPGTIEEVDYLIEFAERLAEGIAGNTDLIGDTAKLINLSHDVLAAPQELRSGVFLSQITATYA